MSKHFRLKTNNDSITILNLKLVIISLVSLGCYVLAYSDYRENLDLYLYHNWHPTAYISYREFYKGCCSCLRKSWLRETLGLLCFYIFHSELWCKEFRNVWRSLDCLLIVSAFQICKWWWFGYIKYSVVFKANHSPFSSMWGSVFYSHVENTCNGCIISQKGNNRAIHTTGVASIHFYWNAWSERGVSGHIYLC